MTRNELILAYQPLVRHIASEYIPLLRSLRSTPLTLDDLIQEGTLGLIEAIDRQRPPSPYIRKFILEHLRCYANALTRPNHSHEQYISLPMSTPVADPDENLTLADVLSAGDTPLTSITEQETREHLQRIWQSFSARDRQLLADAYALPAAPFSPASAPITTEQLPGEPLTTDQLAEKYHLSTDRVKKIRQRAKKMLRRVTLS